MQPALRAIFLCLLLAYVFYVARGLLSICRNYVIIIIKNILLDEVEKLCNKPTKLVLQLLY